VNEIWGAAEEPAGRSLDLLEVATRFRACRPDRADVREVDGARNAALLALLYGARVRAEAVSVEPSQFNPTTRQLKISGKRNKERDTFVGGCR
jgi:site-specific recombinase XerD